MCPPGPSRPSLLLPHFPLHLNLVLGGPSRDLRGLLPLTDLLELELELAVGLLQPDGPRLNTKHLIIHETDHVLRFTIHLSGFTRNTIY